MISEKELKDLEVVFTSQQHMLSTIHARVESVEKSFEGCDETSREVEHAQKLLDEVLADIDLLSSDDLDCLDNLDTEIANIYTTYQNQLVKEYSRIEFTDWDHYLKKCMIFNLENDLELFTPYESFLYESDLNKIKLESYKAQYKWDQWDYLFVGLAGFLAAVVDHLIVAIPKDMTSGKYIGQKGSSLTKWLQSLELPEWLQKWLEEAAKVPYDNTGGSSHRIDTPGHDPILGFVFGIIDIIKGSSTTMKNGKINIVTGVAEGKGLLEALVLQLLHLLSDVATKRGIPVPFASVFRLLDIGSFKRENGKTATIGQLMGWMYHYGYDMRHFVTMSTTPATIEIILRMYILIRTFTEGDEKVTNISLNPKYRSMLLSAHAIASASNVGKVYLRAGNPLAINYAEWLALLRYLVPSMKYWVFDRSRFEIEHMEKISDDEWSKLLENGNNLLEKAFESDSNAVILKE
ncbi:MAG: hypothetical protein KMY55_02725 [Dethiosulfatibacter sp.]|nr:hypothetical protein [Dethiosulfatibacter sp.]